MTPQQHRKKSAARDLEREYRRKRAAILASKTSWEAKMREISRLFAQYNERMNALEKEEEAG